MPRVIASEATSRLALSSLKASSAAERSVAVFREENSTAFAARSGTPLSRTYSLQHPGGRHIRQYTLQHGKSDNHTVTRSVQCALCKQAHDGSMHCRIEAILAKPWQQNILHSV